MADICWKEKMAERCKQTLPPITDKDHITITKD